ncbi:MAG TPA: tail fiber domain-containing protein [Pseudolabrys sp.]|nr:tail fiber domain-containing protein [Pseudolabrys sp.]
MRRFKRITLTAIAIGTALISAQTEAVTIATPGAVRVAAEPLSLIEKTQFVFGGRRYCWYDDAWQGPGWYWCGYAWRRGFGWGGGVGWHGWHHHHHDGGMGGGGMGGGMGGSGGMGGGMGGSGGMGGGMGGSGGMGGGGMGGSGGMGGGGMGMSDIRAKHDVVLLGHVDNGLGFYRFSYNGSDKAFVGVMAQEVEAIMPDAVVRGSDGYLRVNYDRLGLHMQTWEDWVAAGERIPATRKSAQH